MQFVHRGIAHRLVQLVLQIGREPLANVRRRERRGGSGLRRHGRRRIFWPRHLLRARCNAGRRSRDFSRTLHDRSKEIRAERASTAAYSAAAGSSISSPEATGEGTGEGDAGKTEGGMAGAEGGSDLPSPPLPSPLSPPFASLRLLLRVVDGLPIVAPAAPDRRPGRAANRSRFGGVAPRRLRRAVRHRLDRPMGPQTAEPRRRIKT